MMIATLAATAPRRPHTSQPPQSQLSTNQRGRTMWWRIAAAPLSPPPLLLLLSSATARAAPPSALRFRSSPSLRPPAFVSRLPPPPLSSGERRPRVFGDGAALLQDAGVTALVLVGAYSLVRTFDELTKRELIEKNLSRKVVHVLSGLLYMSSWPFFSASAEARYFAAIVPLVNCIRLISYGLCLVKDENLIKSVTREGKPEELLRGPLYYVLVLMFCALIFWRESPIGVVSLAMMSGGDGFADIVGRRFGSAKLPHNRHKSWLGSISMFLFGYLFSIGTLFYFSAFGYIHLDWKQTVEKLAIVSLVATMVESLPISNILDDNISVPFTSMLMVFLVFGYGPS